MSTDDKATDTTASDAGALRIGFIGLGTMGGPMAGRLLEAGHRLKVHNRTRQREEELAARGAERAETPADCAQGCDVVFTMVSDTPDVEAVGRARELIEAFAAAGNPGVVGLAGQMYDRPHLRRAERLLVRARAAGVTD